jgi:hypothetical protein
LSFVVNPCIVFTHAMQIYSCHATQKLAQNLSRKNALITGN